MQGFETTCDASQATPMARDPDDNRRGRQDRGMATETFTNGPRMAQQTHPGQGGAAVGDLLVHEERQEPVSAGLIVTTRKAVRAWERGDSRNASTAIQGVIALYAAGALPKSARKGGALLGFRSETGAIRPLKVAEAAMRGVTPLVTPLRKPTDAPKSIPTAIRYGTWPDAVAAEGITACYNAARAALTEAKELPTRREAFGKAVYGRVDGLRRLMPVGDVALVMRALLDGTLMSATDIEAFYSGPDGDAPMERGVSWDDVVAEAVAESDDDDEASS